MDWYEFLHEAVAARDIDLVRRVLTQGADPNGLGEDGAAPLHHAVLRGDLDTALALLKGGASVAADRDEDARTLHATVEDNTLPVVELLLNYDGGRGLDLFDSIDRTPLMIAITRGNLEIARRLIEAGADVNAHNEVRAGDTALHKAVNSGNLKMVELLVHAQADPTIQGWMWITPLDNARDRKRGDGPRIYKLLEQAAKRYRK